MRTSPKAIGWLLGAVLLLWSFTEGAALVQARVYGPRRVRVVHNIRREPPRNQLLFEGSLVVPQGDLQDDFFTTDKGLSQSNGYELGVRYRYFPSPWVAISPAFHYVRFGEDRGIGDFPSYGDDLGYEIATSIYRYSLDLQSFVGRPDAQVRPFITLGIALNHHRYRDEIVGYFPYKHSANGLAVTGGLGLQFGPVEVSGVYVYDRFETDGLPSATADDDWNWDHVVVRAGLSLGRF